MDDLILQMMGYNLMQLECSQMMIPMGSHLLSLALHIPFLLQANY